MSDTPVDSPAAPELAFNLDGCTPRMLLDFREKAGVSLMSFVDAEGGLDLSSLTEEAIAGVVWLALRMKDPATTYEQALDVPFTEALSAESAAPAVDPS